MIVKDPAKPFKEQLAASPVPGFTKVIGVGKLRKNFKQYKDRLELVGQYDAFFADDRVVRMMPQVCGKIFGERKKMPLPVKMYGKDWAKHLADARDSAWFTVGAKNVSVRIGRSNMTAEQIVENFESVIDRIVSHMPKKWKNVQRVDLHSTNTVMLPLFKSLPTPTLREDDDDDETDDSEDDEVSLEGKTAAGGKTKAPAGKRARVEKTVESDESEGDDDDDEEGSDSESEAEEEEAAPRKRKGVIAEGLAKSAAPALSGKKAGAVAIAAKPTTTAAAASKKGTEVPVAAAKTAPKPTEAAVVETKAAPVAKAKAGGKVAAIAPVAAKEVAVKAPKAAAATAAAPSESKAKAAPKAKAAAPAAKAPAATGKGKK